MLLIGRIKSRKSTTWASFKGREKANSPISPGLQAPPTPALFVFPTRVDEERYKLRARARCNSEFVFSRLSLFVNPYIKSNTPMRHGFHSIRTMFCTLTAFYELLKIPVCEFNFRYGTLL